MHTCPALGFRLSNTISLSNYHIFEMPEVIRRKRPRDWTKKEAREYFEWFMAIKPARTAQIREISEARDASSDIESFSLITETLRRSLQNLVRVEDGEQYANGLGFIAGFDAALVVGDHLVEAVDDAAWQVMDTPINTFMSKNFPVVRRPGLLQVFEPFVEGRTILTLLGREVGKKPSNVLAEKYRMWLEGFSSRS